MSSTSSSKGGYSEECVTLSRYLETLKLMQPILRDILDSITEKYNMQMEL